MFEQSVCVVSGGGGVSARGARWTWAGSVVLQCLVAALLIGLPLLHPERLTLLGTAPRLVLPMEAKPRVIKAARVSARAVGAAALAVASPKRMITAPAVIAHEIGVGDPPPASVMGLFDGLGTAALPGAAIREGMGMPVVIAHPLAARGPMRVSTGIATGMLLAPIRPVYPEIARAARVEGVVVVEAVISREGVVEQAHVLRGPAMLAGAALEAVERARYQPYRLNGGPVAVTTTFTVNFRLGG